VFTNVVRGPPAAHQLHSGGQWINWDYNRKDKIVSRTEKGAQKSQGICGMDYGGLHYQRLYCNLIIFVVIIFLHDALHNKINIEIRYTKLKLRMLHSRALRI
jgi:hypothetical protein